MHGLGVCYCLFVRKRKGQRRRSNFRFFVLVAVVCLCGALLARLALPSVS